MAKQKQDEAPVATTEAPKKERTVLTPAQRVAKLEADLAAARERAEKQANKARDKAYDQRAKLVTKRDELTAKIEAIDAEFPQDQVEDAGA